MLARLTGLLGSRAAALALCWEEALITLAVADFSDTMEQLRAERDNLAGSAPGREERGEGVAQRKFQWSEAFRRVQLRAIEEDCCFHLPLDHPFGESLEERPVEHWEQASRALRAEREGLGG